MVWDQVYRASSSLLPAGPFAYHSAKDLEDMLTRSEKLAATWTRTSSPLLPVSRRVITEGWDENVCLCMLLGRWLFVGGCFGMNCYDLDATDWDRPAAHLSGNIRSIEGQVSTSDAGVHSAFLAVTSNRTFACVQACQELFLPITDNHDADGSTKCIFHLHPRYSLSLRWSWSNGGMFCLTPLMSTAISSS